MDGSGRKAIIRLSKKHHKLGVWRWRTGSGSKGLRKTKDLRKCNYGWVQEESNEMDADVGNTCMVKVLSAQIDLRYQLKGLSGGNEKRKSKHVVTHVAPIRF